ncbi:hypothetical protein BP6252_02183 [Coleophoma cylindrospora]|uniref:Uncharacterized protein n=1 Tax=Coleophoma cylindrospora TaxID=1849047 RepID=A0A3D8SE49_9HELO|nr:hypothetical protein BP6252_02183 [Coleophoma cylindrospora]
MSFPPRREMAADASSDDSHLPKGDCRFILLHPEVKGLRCACVGFALNRSIPGSTCDCGHQACYHSTEKEPPVDWQELEILKNKISLLEDQLDRERHGGRGGLVDRLGRLEELVDKSNAENETDVKGLYRGIGGLWYNVGLLNKRAQYYDDHFEGLVDGVQRIQNRLIEIDDASMSVEERVEALEGSRSVFSTGGRERKASTPPSIEYLPETPCSSRQDEGSAISLQLVHKPVVCAPLENVQQAWTVHISLMPSASNPFPFEKDTAAYKRCLSRGLHRVVAVPGTDSYSFVNAVSEAFSDILLGRAWMPLVAKLCDVETLQGLPMLRELHSDLINKDYDVNFLKQNCAILNSAGKIDHLYVAMIGATLSWADLRHSPCFLKGLESCWEYEPYLDGPCSEPDILNCSEGQLGTLENQPAAGDITIVPRWSSPNSRLKRTSSEISRAASFGSSAEAEVTRAKMRRQCATTNVEVVERRAEAV